MSQTIRGYLIDQRDYEALTDVGQRLSADRKGLGSVERQDLAGLMALALVRIQSIVICLEHGLPNSPPPCAGEDDD